MTEAEAPQSRVVRVFISSTFRDLQAERDRLVKFAFPELRRRCRERQVELVEVDLRWGVTEEQSERGEALPICLAEIERCRPYFIGLLGERYGFVPKAFREELLETQPWLVEHREHSITELEIIHGVLRSPEMAPRAFFYFRDPAYLECIPAEQAADFTAERPEAREKLQALKARIRGSGLHLREDYPDPETLGNLVRDDLWEVIDAAYPAGSEPDALDRETAEHEAFSEARRKVYIGRAAYDEALDQYVLGDGPPLVILGESGVGKSALLANWAANRRREHPEDFVLLHFTGNTPYSADYVAILRRIFGEIRRRFDVAEAIPESPEQLREAFPTWLAMASARLSVLAGEGGRGEGTAGPTTPRFILILDGLNQLEDKDAAPHLGWLPEHFPPNVRLVVSALPGASLDALVKRGWPSLTVEGIRPEERRTLIGDYLAQSSRALEPRRVDRIVAASQTENPLYLRALLDELRVFGIRHALDRRIEHYLAAETVADLYGKILERWEQDYEPGRPGLVRDAMSLLWAARRGLAERELLELLGAEGDPLPGALWTPLALAAEQSLVTRSGLIGFAHDYVRHAVQHRVLPSEERQQAAHLRLADYFEPRQVDARKADELPWQLAAAGAKARLKAVLTDLRMFEKLITEDRAYELAGYWLSLGGRAELEPAYLAALDDYERSGSAPDELANTIGDLGGFLQLSACYDAAEPLCRRALAAKEQALGPAHPETATALNNLAFVLRDKGDYAAAEPFYRRALAAREQALGPDHPDTAVSLDGLGSLLQCKGDYAAAESFYRRALAAKEQALGAAHPASAATLHQLASLLQEKGDYAAAEPLYRQALAAKEQALGPTHPETAKTLHQLAWLLQQKGEYAAAERLYRRALAAKEQAVGPDHPATSETLQALASVLQEKRDYAEAESLYRRALVAFEKKLGPANPWTTATLKSLASFLVIRTADYHGAEFLYRRALAAEEQVLGPEHPGTATTLHDIALLLYRKGDYAGAEPLYRQALRAFEKALGSEHPSTATTLHALALLLQAKGDYAGAEPLYRRALAAFEKALGSEHPATATTLHALASLLQAKGDYAGAEPLYRRALAASEKSLGPEHPSTAATLHRLASLLQQTGYPADAELLYRRSLASKEQALGLGHRETLATLFAYGQLLRDLDRQEEAAALYRKVLEGGQMALAAAGTDIPEILTWMAISADNLAFHTDVSSQNWADAEAHYRQSIDIFTRAGNELEARNAELNLQTMFHLAGRPVDLERVRALTHDLEAAGDPRAEKGRKLLAELGRG